MCPEGMPQGRALLRLGLLERAAPGLRAQQQGLWGARVSPPHCAEGDPRPGSRQHMSAGAGACLTLGGSPQPLPSCGLQVRGWEAAGATYLLGQRGRWAVALWSVAQTAPAVA